MKNKNYFRIPMKQEKLEEIIHSLRILSREKDEQEKGSEKYWEGIADYIEKQIGKAWEG